MAHAQYSIQVHGIFHRNADGSDRQKIIRACRVGDPVFFMLEPENPFDPKAIKVCRANGEQLGYVEADKADQFRNLLFANRIAKGTIEEIYAFPDDPHRHGASICVEVESASAPARSAPAAPMPRKGMSLVAKLSLTSVGAIILIMMIVSGDSGNSQAQRDAGNQNSSTEAPTAPAAPDPNEIAFQNAVRGAKALKDAMRDPDSFKLTQVLVMPGGTACYEYHSKNGFGGMNDGQAVLSPDGTIRSSEMAGFSRSWKNGCAGKSGDDKTWEVGLAAGFHGMFSDQ